MSIGKIAEFKVHHDDWRLYVERLEQYFIVNKIPSELQVPTLITVMGAEGYELLVNLCTPDRPKSKTFALIADIMERHLQPKPSELAERYKFRHRKQKEGETIAEYTAILKRMSKTCDFGAWLEESLRDQLVCGITNETIRQRLFAESKLDFGKAYKLAVSMEAAEKDAAEVVGRRESNESSTVPVTASCQAITTKRSVRRNEVATAAAAGTVRDVSGTGRQAAWQRGPRALPARAGARRELGERAQPQQCQRCGARHDAATCKFARYVCRVCNRPGHLQRMCPNLAAHLNVDIDEISEGSGSDEVIFVDVCKLSAIDCKPVYVNLNVNGLDIKMECDTGSAVSCISKECYNRMFKDLCLNPCRLTLRYYTGESVKPLGVILPVVKYKDMCKTLELFVIENGKTILLGRQWMAELKIQLPLVQYECNKVSMYKDSVFDVSSFSSKYSEVFADGLGRFTGGKASIHVREGARPVFMRARPLAYALREPVERALAQLQRDGILSPVERSDWATPIVPVIKKDGNIRICADYKLTLNRVIEVDRYPLPRIEELLLQLRGGEHFSKIDLSQAYAQFELDDTKKYTVINTHKGLFMYNRLVYGLSSSPAIFQKWLEQLFADLPQVGVFLDDIIITGSNRDAHMQNLCQVFDRLKKYGLRVKKDKCVFFAKSVNYLGHTISKDGVHTCPDKVKAITKTPAPTNVSELRAFIGMIMYYGKFIKNISTVLAPLYHLLKTGVRYVWNKDCQDAFNNVKCLLTSSKILMHYTPELPLILTTDASSVGIGAVISHVTASGERPVAYASRSLTQAERAYSQIDREALAIIFGVRKFHQFLYGRKFILRTDHKPLTYIFGNKVGIPVMAASRLQRWAVLLAGYTYEIEYVSSNKNCADALSRLPCNDNKSSGSHNENTYVNFVENFLPVTSTDVKAATACDNILNRVFRYTQSGWPIQCPDNAIQPYFIRRNELYTEGGCLMWGYRMVIPLSLQNKILKQLHSSHMGIVKTKSLARSYVWWPNIDNSVEDMCKQCETCAAEADAPRRAQVQPWPYHTRPWSRLHIDFLGPYKGSTFLVIVDSTSKWIEVFEMARTNATSVIKVLRSTFARYGLPEEVVSDQGPPFTSSEFKMFLRNNGVKQFFSPAYHPSSNGAAENAVKLCKRAIKKAHRDQVDIDTALQTFLLAYRNTVHSTTGETPAMLLQRRSLRSRLDLLRNEGVVVDRVRDAQRRQAEYAGGSSRNLREGDSVWARDYGSRDKWVKGIVQRVDSTRRYSVVTDSGQLYKRHIDQVRRRSRLSNVIGTEGNDEDEEQHTEENVVEQQSKGVEGIAGSEARETMNDKKGEDITQSSRGGVDSELSPPRVLTPSVSPVNRYSKRVRKPVDRFRIE